MPPSAKRRSLFVKSAQHVDENGVPTIQSSVGLMLLGFALFVSVPATALGLLYTFSMAATGEASDGRETWALASNYRLMLWVTGNLRAFYLGWMCLAAYNFFSQRSAAPRMLMQLVAGGIVLSLLEGWWEASFAAGDEAYAMRAMGDATRGAFWAAIWFIYVWRSRSVSKVFVYPLPERAEPMEIVEFVEATEAIESMTTGRNEAADNRSRLPHLGKTTSSM